MINKKTNATVLVVEDEAPERVFYHYILSGQQYNLLWAENGLEAIDLILREKVDIVLLDLFLPKMDGFELCKWLQSTEDYKDLPVVIISARGNKEDVYKLYSMGYTYYFDKPVFPKTLIKQINSLLNKRLVKHRNNPQKLKPN